MTIFQAFILGIVQGITEFLPISSSGHLVLTPFLLNWQIPEEQVFVFDVLVQIGTLVAVIAFFWADLWAILTAFLSSFWKREAYQQQDVRMGLYLIVATIPAVVLGLLLKDTVEAAFSSPTFTVLALVFTAVLMIAAELFSKRTMQDLTGIGWLDALVIGLFQALALFPGVSRSGSTISGGLFRSLDRPAAARFSFLLSVPVMLGAGGLAVLDLLDVPNLGSFILPMAVGFVTAAVVGYLSIRWLLSYLTKNPLTHFSIYLILLSTLILILK
jgi:undecaprenyl-diphosphatase